MVIRRLIGVLALCASAAPGDTLTLAPSKDNTLYHDPLGLVSNGAGMYIFAGTTLRSNSVERRALIAFDLSAIPPGATVTGARLTLHMSRAISGDVTVALHRMVADWGEGASIAPFEEGIGAPAAPGDATWMHSFSPGTLWSAPGGDFEPQASAATPVGIPGFYTWGDGGELIADVQRWVDDGASNFGWVVIGDESINGTAKRFASRQHTDPAVRPSLVVDFSLPAECDPDVNCDGVPDQGDVACIILAVAGDLGCFCQADPDFNGDGVPDQGDVVDVMLAVAGGPCR